MERLTERQKEILGFIEKYSKEYGVAPSIRDIASKFSIQVRAVADHLKALERKGYIERLPGRSRGIIIKKSLNAVPVLGFIPAGKLTFTDEVFDEYLSIDPALFGTGEIFALRVRGDSMIGDHIVDGDIVFIRRQDTVKNGEIAAVLVDGEVTLKRVYFKGNKIILKPSNPSMSPIEVKDARILGVFVGLLRR